MVDSPNNGFGLDGDKCQVFLLICPVKIPLSIAVHPWLVVNRQGLVSRWEILSRNVDHELRWGQLYRDFFPPFQGLEILPYSRYFWPARLLGEIEGQPAERMAEWIESSPVRYPFCDEYALWGPNSNTFVQWILNEFPEFPARLPWNSFGRGYLIRV